jgi:death-on-curing protein
VKYLTLEQIVFINDRIIHETGGQRGIRDLGLLHASSERPKASFAGKDLYSTLFEKAAALAHSIILNHPFLDGNKRTALASMTLFLELNGVFLSITQEEAVWFSTWIESQKPSLKEIAAWLIKHRSSV